MAKADRLLFVIVMAVFANFGLAIFNGLMGHLKLLFLNLLGVAVPLAILYGSQHAYRTAGQRTGRGAFGGVPGAARLAASWVAANPGGCPPPRPSGDPELVAGPIIAYRGWDVSDCDGHLALYSLRDCGPWPEGRSLEAVCLLSPASVHASPDWQCTCGIYALKRARDAAGYGLIFGSVELSGRVIEHEGGYRAQYAKIHAIFDESACGRPWLRQIAAWYHVPLINVRQ